MTKSLIRIMLMYMIYPPFLSLDKKFTEYDSSQYALIPVPYDGTSTYGKGADKGPLAIMEASDQLEFYDPETEQEACARGIYTDTEPFTFPKSSEGVEEMVKQVEERVSLVIKDRKVPIVIGGEHSVTIGAVYAAASVYQDLTVLQIDAHSDMRDIYKDSPFNHACVMARVCECSRILQVGIRSCAKEELIRINNDRIWWDHQIHGSLQWIEEVVSKITGPVYITFDLDGFDPSLLPATGTPQPGGLSWQEALTLLRRVYSTGKVIGWDITELCPDGTRSSPFVAAKLLYKMINYHSYYLADTL